MKILIAVLIVVMTGLASCHFREQKVILLKQNPSGDFFASVEVKSSVVTNPVYTEVYIVSKKHSKDRVLVFQMRGPSKVNATWKNAHRLLISYPCFEKPSYIYQVFEKRTSALGIKIAYQKNIKKLLKPTKEDKAAPPSVKKVTDAWAILDMTSVSANMPHILLIVTFLVDLCESEPSWSMPIFNAWEITSRKRPVPAAHLSFIMKSTVLPEEASSFMILVS